MPTKNKFIFGLHSVLSVLKQRPQHVQVIYIQKKRDNKRLQEIIELADTVDITVQQTARQKLDDMVSGQHQGVIAQCKAAKSKDLIELLDQLAVPPFLLLLDGVQDPHNLGACLRSANAAGVHAVIAPKDNAVGLTPTVHKVASGAAEATPFIVVTNLTRTITMLKERNIWLYGAEDSGKQSLFETDLKGPIALVLGAEGKGLRLLTKKHCDHLVKIPMLGTVSSLNVSVAAGIFLFEAVRQRILC